MTSGVRPDLDLTLSRVIHAPCASVWNAWTDRASFEKWWVPAPEVCRVVDMELAPGGSFRTQISQDGVEFMSHISGCFLAVDAGERIVFTDSLLGGWRPAESPFMTAVITMRDHPLGTDYTAHVMHQERLRPRPARSAGLPRRLGHGRRAAGGVRRTSDLNQNQDLPPGPRGEPR